MDSPRLCFALPVYNGAERLERVLDSILAQTFSDFELVISDNASTDRTPEICRELEGRDARVRYCPNAQNIGLLRNFNRLVGLARAEYFRWIGIDDWLEPGYAEACVAALDAHPEAIGVTTYQAHWDDQGQRSYREWTGPRVDSPRASERFARMLWLLQAEFSLMDPIYSTYRRRVLAATRLHRIVAAADRPLAAELSLHGPYCHVPRLLAHRRRVPETPERTARKCTPPGHPPLVPTFGARMGALLDVVREAPLPAAERLRCRLAVARYGARELLRRGRRGARRTRPWLRRARPVLDRMRPGR